MERLRRRINAALIVGSLVVGLAGCGWLMATKPEAPKRRHADRILEVATLTITPVVETTPVIGHGTVRPKKQVDIVPQVSGKLTFVHAALAQGKVIPKGDLLFEIDPTVYDARLRQAEAEVKGLDASLTRHDQEASNLKAQIDNAEQMLAIDARDFDTSKNLYDQEHVGTQRDVDLLQQKYLRQQGVVVELRNNLAMIPHLRTETEARLEAARSRLRQAEHDLENTRIFCPFEARVETVLANESQVVTAPFAIAKLTDMEALEISVGIDPRELRWLAEEVRPEALDAAGSLDDAAGKPSVAVRWRLHGQEFTWRGNLSRFERVDEATRTARMVVEVRRADMTATAGSGDRDGGPRTLSVGMFCTTELPAEPLADALLVPRHAIHDNRWVYVFEPDADSSTGRLVRREVPMLRSIRDQVVVDFRGRGTEKVCELQAGDRVVVSPLTKPVAGMRIRLRDAAATSVTWIPVSSAAPTRFVANRNAPPRAILAISRTVGPGEP